MAQDGLFSELFFHAFELHRQEFSVRDSEIVRAMHEIQHGYRPKDDTDRAIRQLDYNNPALRCAYLHKYAGFHAALVERVLLQVHCDYPWILSEVFFTAEGTNICCLGGGPGNDVIGMSSAFCAMPESSGTHFTFTIVDKMHAWAYTHDTVLRAAESGRYGRLGEFLSTRVSSSYHGADILSDLPVPMNDIRSADIVTMIKFVSAVEAVESEDTPKMLQRVFEWLKPGALVLFIDNDAARIHETVSEVASKCNLEVAFGPVRRYKYENDSFGRTLFGISNLSRTTVSVQIWRKPLPVYLSRQRLSHRSNPYGRQFAENGWHSRRRQNEPNPNVWRPQFWNNSSVPVWQDNYEASGRPHISNGTYDTLQSSYLGPQQHHVTNNMLYSRQEGYQRPHNFTEQGSSYLNRPRQRYPEIVSCSTRYDYSAPGQHVFNSDGFNGMYNGIRR